MPDLALPQKRRKVFGLDARSANLNRGGWGAASLFSIEVVGLDEEDALERLLEEELEVRIRDFTDHAGLNRYKTVRLGLVRKEEHGKEEKVA